ncbi:THUMP domain-containing protein 2-like [Pecten maximus]|uniref:THUMP domain-containing protein 2-like n=1 Tax=Pecten maximus TaxID=6579 RepID=UPI0014582EF6|nr:THUMP domain-containing protein 2-like [Pecten maximus]
MHFFCSAGRGTEKFVAEEIRRKLSGREIQVTDGKVFFQADAADSGAVGQLRSIERAFVQVVRHSCLDGVKTVKDVGNIILSKDLWTSSDLIDLVAKIHSPEGNASSPESKKRRIEEEKPPVTFRISCKCAGRIGRRIQSQVLSRYIGCGLQRLVNWKVNLRNPSIEICVHMNDDRLTVGIPLQSIPVSKRSYIRHFGLRGTIAWIMSDLLDIQPCDVVLDPMCGKATLLVEACHNFMAASYLGMDINKDQLSKAAENLLWSRLYGNIGLVQGDARCMPLASGSIDKVLCDAPFGQNFHPDCENILEFYKKSLMEISRVLKPGGRLVLLTSQQLSLKVCGLCGQSDDKDSEPESKQKAGGMATTSNEPDQVKVTQSHGQVEVTALHDQVKVTPSSGQVKVTPLHGQVKVTPLHDQVKVTPLTLKNSGMTESDKGNSTIQGTSECESESTVILDQKLAYHPPSDLKSDKSMICEPQKTFVQTDKKNHSDNVPEGESVLQEEQRQGRISSSSQGHINDFGCITNDDKNQTSPHRKDNSLTYLNKLQVMASHYVKLGETDATICVIHKVDER